MINVDISFDLLYKLLLYVLLPTIGIIIISRIIIVMCTRKTKANNRDKYYFIMNCWTSLVAIAITVVLMIVAYMYSKYFTTTLQEKGLIEKAMILYYIVSFCPIIPFGYFIYYIVELFGIIKNHNDDIKFRINTDEDNDNIEIL